MTRSGTRLGLATMLALAIALAPAGCARWKKGGGAPPADDVVALEPSNPLLPKNAKKLEKRNAPDTGGAPVDSVTGLKVEGTVHGAIIWAEGLTSRQGAYDARLIPDDSAGDGVLGYTFKIYYPKSGTPVGGAATREVVVARTLTRRELRGIRTIRVAGAGNAREVRRR